jgi:hypothetical protein
MERLEAPSSILEKYKILEKKDILSSTAIQDPNEPGYSTLRLSWIWQTEQAVPGSQGTTRECKCRAVLLNPFNVVTSQLNAYIT